MKLQQIAVLFLVVSGVLLVGVVTAQEPGTETLVSVGEMDTPQYSPDVSATTIVWVDGVSGSLHIYDAVTGNETILQSDTYSYELPAVSGDYVVAQAFELGLMNYDIFLYHISTGEGTIITPDWVDSDEIAPAIFGPYVAWKSYSYTDETCRVFLYDLTSPSDPVQISDTTGSCGCLGADPFCIEPYSPPSISGEAVVWEAIVGDRYDIFLYTIRTPGEPPVNITPDTLDSDQEYPVISGDIVVWQDNRNGNWDIFLANISNRSEITISPLTTAPFSQLYPSIDGNRVVWRDGESEALILYDIPASTEVTITPPMRQPDKPEISGEMIVYEGDIPPRIYLFTHDILVTCPVASFTNLTSRSAAEAPLTVQFADTSNPPPEVTIWDFGEGTDSRESTPEHTYQQTGTYDVLLTISTPYCRDQATMTDFVTVGQEPVVNFTGTPTCGLAPLRVSFIDRSSGNPTERGWDFENDGGIDSTIRNPTHQYGEGGFFSVNLTAGNSVGSSHLLLMDYIAVLDRSGRVADTTIEGLSTDGSGTAISLNTSILPDYSLEGTYLTIHPPTESGISQIVLAGDSAGFVVNGDRIEGTITTSLITSDTIALQGFDPSIGSEAFINFTLEFSGYPAGATITPYSFESSVPCDRDTLHRIVSSSGFSELSRTAYEIRLVTSHLDPVINMTLYLGVNSSWVTDREKVWVVRMGDDMIGQVLPTRFVYQDSPKNLDVFTAYSPRGPSTFVLTVLSQAGNPLQIVVLTAQQWFDGDGGGDDYGGGPIVTATTTRAPTPVTVTPTTLPVPEPTSTPETLEQATMEIPIPTPTLPVIESPPSPVPTTTTPLPPFITIIAWAAAAGVLWLVKRRE